MKRFWDKVQKGPDCWEWQGFISQDGYGETSYKSKTIRAHRLSWILERGDIPNGLCVLHACDNRKCVNPEHLFLGTREENCQDMRNKNRHVIPVGSHNGKSKLSEEQVVSIRQMYANGGWTHRSLGEYFGVNHSTIGFVLRNEAWRHVK